MSATEIPTQPPSQDPGFEPAGGQPDQIFSAAAVHSDLANMLEEHGAVVQGMAMNLAGAWQGEAASSYQQLSQYVHNYHADACLNARAAASALNRFGNELARCQHVGKAALERCQHWLREQQHWFFQMQDAKQKLDAAKSTLAFDKALSPAPSAASSAGGGPLSLSFPGAPTPASNAAQISADQSAVTAAEAVLAAAQKKFEDATDEVLVYQGIGRQAWDDAMGAAATVTGSLSGIRITPPPLAGFPRHEPTIERPVPWYDTALNIVGDINGVVGAVAGGVAVVMFWNPIGEGATAVAGVSAAASVGIDGLKTLGGEDVSPTDWVLDSTGAVLAGGGKALELVGDGVEDTDPVAKAAAGAAGDGSGDGKSLLQKGLEPRPKLGGKDGAVAGLSGVGAIVSSGSVASGAEGK